MIGGQAATGHDFLVSQTERIPYAVGVVLLAMFAVLFLLFGSVVLPIKAILMTLLSISASFGAMVWIFQEGNLSGSLGFTSPGFTIAGNPIIMFSVLFGLSMDYEVLLLSRVQEAYRRSGDNRAAVAEGLSKTAGVITGAAADHGHGVRGVRPGRHDHDQEHRRRAWRSRCSSTRRSSGSCWCRPRCGCWASGTGGRPGRWPGSPIGSASATRRTRRRSRRATKARCPATARARRAADPA